MLKCLLKATKKSQYIPSLGIINLQQIDLAALAIFISSKCLQKDPTLLKCSFFCQKSKLLFSIFVQDFVTDTTSGLPLLVRNMLKESIA